MEKKENQTNQTWKTTWREYIVGFLCLACFPLLYLVGNFINSLF